MVCVANGKRLSWLHFELRVSLTKDGRKEATVRILIADDHPIVRAGLSELLALQTNFEIVGEACDGREALDKVRRIVPDILLLDLRMPHLDGLAVLEALQGSELHTRVVLLTAWADKFVFERATKLGCCAMLPKHSDTDLIVECIRKVNAGQPWFG